MHNKIFLFFFLILTSASFAQFLAPKAAVQPMEYDFGNINEDEKVSTNFVITNAGGDVLKIIKVRASCGCTAAQPDKNELQPGESTNIKVEFNSKGRTGVQQKYIYVTTNDTSNKELKLKIKGNVVKNESKSKAGSSPQIHFQETEHDFGVVNEGEVKGYTFKFVNNGSTILEIKDIKTSCGCTAALVSNKKIEPGKEGTLKVELDTKNRNGRMSRNITITSNDPEEPKKILTIYADVKKEIN